MYLTEPFHGALKIDGNIIHIYIYTYIYTYIYIYIYNNIYMCVIHMIYCIFFHHQFMLHGDFTLQVASSTAVAVALKISGNRANPHEHSASKAPDASDAWLLASAGLTKSRRILVPNTINNGATQQELHPKTSTRTFQPSKAQSCFCC
jgi:hypothetical protein